VIAQLRDKNVVAHLFINNPMLGSDTPGPISMQRMFERLRLADAMVWISSNVPQKLVNARDNLRIGPLPVQVFLPRLRREGDVHVSSFSLFRITLPRLAASIESSKRFALAGDRSRYAVSCSDSYSASESMTTA
jgi:hypothetical protein